VRNAFEVHVTNKNAAPAQFTISLHGAPEGSVVVVGTPKLELASLTDALVPVSISIPRAQLKTPPQLTLTVVDETNGNTRSLNVGFLGR
jgi:hypothetical protein